ncbi:MAG: hypothetical protein HY537_12920 [Deltaproteobacteria bacterium]|nr:hypothetical protein [Deltaproteobacteria bacterium]
MDTIDADASIETARAMVEQHTLAVSVPNPEPMLYRRIGANTYSKLGLAMPLIYIGPIVAAKLISKYTGFGEHLLRIFLVSCVNGLVTACIVTLLFAIFCFVGYSTRLSLIVSLTAGFSTYLFVYAKSSHRDPLHALCILGAYAWPLLARESRFKNIYFIMVGLCSALLLMSKPVLVLAVIPAWWLATKQALRVRGQKTLFSLYGPLLIAIVLTACLARLVWGSFLATGYSKEVMTFHSSAWTTPFWNGVWVQLFAPATGLFYFNPVLCLCVLALAWKLWRRTCTELDGCLVLSIAAMIAIHAKWLSPTGGSAFGPRYLVPTVPLFFLFFIGLPLSQYKRPILAVFISCCFIFQLIHVSVKAEQYWTFRQKTSPKMLIPHWRANIHFFLHKLTNQPEIYSASLANRPNKRMVNLTAHRSLEGFNFWWAHLIRHPELLTTNLRHVHMQRVSRF